MPCSSAAELQIAFDAAAVDGTNAVACALYAVRGELTVDGSRDMRHMLLQFGPQRLQLF